MWPLLAARKLAKQYLAFKPLEKKTIGRRVLGTAAGLVSHNVCHKSKVGKVFSRTRNKCVKVWSCKILCTFGQLQAALEQWGMLKQARKVDSGQKTRCLVG